MHGVVDWILDSSRDVMEWCDRDVLNSIEWFFEWFSELALPEFIVLVRIQFCIRVVGLHGNFQSSMRVGLALRRFVFQRSRA